MNGVNDTRVDSLASALLMHPASSDLPPDCVRALAQCAALRDFSVNEYLWRQGDTAECLFLIRDGWVGFEIQVPNQGPLCIDAVGSGGVVGSVPPLERSHFDARALTPVAAIALAGPGVLAECEVNRELGYQFLKRLMFLLARQLEVTRMRMLELAEAHTP